METVMNKGVSDIQYQKGFQDGVRNRSISIAIKLIKMGYKVGTIHEITQLTEDEIMIITEILFLNQHEVDKTIETQQNNHVPLHN